jgi:hypothetical protein
MERKRLLALARALRLVQQLEFWDGLRLSGVLVMSIEQTEIVDFVSVDLADVFSVHPFRSSRRASYRLMHFPNELLTAFVHTDCG